MEQLDALRRFVGRRAGPRWQDYVGAPRETLLADHRQFMRDGRDALKMLNYLSFCATTSATFNEFGVVSARLTWDGQAWEFTACQYEPVEYRAAACRWLAAAIEAFWDIPHGKGRRDAILDRARKAFGRGIAQRWFR